MPQGPATAPTQLLGRDGDAAQLLSWLQHRERLVTVLGPGGIGKTALTRALLAQCREFFSTVIECRLGQVTSAQAVLTHVASALSVPLLGDGEHSHELERALAAAQGLLLVLDEAEGVRVELADLLAGWLSCAPEVTFLVTSRGRLALPEEQVLQLGPLPAAAAVELFQLRYSGQRSPAPPPVPNEAVERLVVLLDGIPLAVELAAARARQLGVEELISRGPRRLDLLLSTPAKSQPHKSLRDTIAWSWELCSAKQRRVAEGCSVFRGGFRPSDLEGALDEPATLDILGELQDQSFLISLGPTHPGGEPRFRLYEPIADFLDLELDSGRRRHLELGHAQRFATRGADSPRQFFSGKVVASDWLRSEEGNLEVAFERCASDEPLLAAQVAVPLAVLYCTSGLYPHNRARLLRARECADRAGDTELSTLLQVLLARAAGQRGLFEEAWLQAEPRRPLGEGGAWQSALEAQLLEQRGHVLGWRGEVDEALQLLDAADALAGPAALEAQRVSFALQRAAAQFHAEKEGAEEQLQQCRRRIVALGAPRLEAAVLLLLGRCRYREGDAPGAAELLQQSLDRLRPVGDDLSALVTTAELAAALRTSGEVEEALDVLEPALGEIRTRAFPAAELMLEAERGWCLLKLGRGAELSNLPSKLRGLLPLCEVARARETAEELVQALRAEPPAPGLVVEAASRWFEIGGQRVDLTRRRGVRLILDALAAHRESGSETPMSVQQLFAVGWPGSSIRESSMRKRVYTAIWTLRSLGLEETLLTRGDGYVLDPEVALERR